MRSDRERPQARTTGYRSLKQMAMRAAAALHPKHSNGEAARRRHIEDLHALAAIRSELVEAQQQFVQLRGSVSRSEEPLGADLASASVSPGPTSPLREEGSSAPPDEMAGVNVFGDWAATTGLAQAARRLAVALSEGGFDLSLATVRSGAPLEQARVPDVLRRIPDDRRHVVDLWMLNVNEFPVIGDDLLRPPDRTTYAVGVWYWELPTFPESLLAQMNRVDEIWVATRFVQSSFRNATNRPVHVVPAVVPDPRGAGRTRRDFGLADDEVVFLFSFDVHSMVARKNPGAVIQAFSMAFSSSEPAATRLVMKVLNLDRHPRVAVWLREAVASVGGVLIEDELSDEELVDLFTCADSYVSLHRSEGFGFGIAEAMALGKPVIATAYSGNVDFATAENSCQVGYRVTEITSEDHLFDEGASEVYRIGALWAEPNLTQAARWMRLLAEDPLLRTRIGDAGRATIRGGYSADAAVRVVIDRLREINARIGLKGRPG